MKLLRSSLAILAASVLSANAQTTVATDPVGFVTLNVTAGTGAAKKNTLFSLPLSESEAIDGQVAGVITSVTANTIVNANAGWTAGALSDPSTPYLIQITSGAAEGRMFLIASSAATGGAIAGAANTATEVTVSPVDAVQVDLTTLGIVGGSDTYRIFACDTLGSFFGTPVTTGILGGAAAGTADTVIAVVNGSSSTYFYSTTLNRWTKVTLGSPDASNVPLVPYYGIQYSRLGNTALSFVITGEVPAIKRQVAIKNSGPTFLAQYWPADSTLSSLGLQTIPGWQSGATVGVADTVILTTAGVASTYFYDGVNWRKVTLGTPNADATPILVGTTVLISKKGVSAGYSTLNQALPYSL